jgi:hypothetical protein
MVTAVKHTASFNAVTDYRAAAVHAGWRQRLDSAFETIEDMRTAVHGYLETLVIFVAAGFASSHKTSYLSTGAIAAGLVSATLRIVRFPV